MLSVHGLPNAWEVRSPLTDTFEQELKELSDKIEKGIREILDKRCGVKSILAESGSSGTIIDTYEQPCLEIDLGPYGDTAIYRIRDILKLKGYTVKINDDHVSDWVMHISW